MLKEFSIKNFKSFKEETLFSMEADIERVSEFENHIVNINRNNLLKVASMYGPNGGGKSNVLQALALVVAIQQNLGFSDSDELPCVFSSSSDIEETLFFVDDKYEMGYHFVIAPGEIEVANIIGVPEKYRPSVQSFEIIKEDVVYRKCGIDKFNLLYSRDNTGKIESEYFGSLTDKKDFKLAKKMTVLKYMFNTFAESNDKLPEYFDVVRHLMNQINSLTVLEIFRNKRFDDKIEALISKHKSSLLSLLNNIDLKIKDIRLYKDRAYPLYFVREVAIDNSICEKEISLYNESSGTRKTFWILMSILENLEKGKIFWCDDMNAYLHPKLFRAIIEIFQNNEYGSQLIFNSHDILNMDNTLFRRDEIWFAYRNENYATQLVPLSNIVNYKGEQVRKDAKYHKQYLEGKYGADPFIKRGLNWNEN